MTHTFYKYQGTGNDFVIIDNRELEFDKLNTNLVKNLCNRYFGVGADGLMLLENHSEHDFKMVYYNSDGNQSTMCGNGGRCLVAFAKFLGIINTKATFEAIDGLHHAEINNDIIALEMQDVTTIENHNTHLFLDTGSPHHVTMVNDLEQYNVKDNGAKIRYGEPYGKAGSNVNFVNKISNDTFAVRTYERGVEDETLSCGTGVTAVAIAMHNAKHTDAETVHLKTPGGDLQVSFKPDNGAYKKVWLTGPAKQVFKGEIEW